MSSQRPAAAAASAPARRAAGTGRAGARAWVLAAAGLALLGAGCHPTKGNDGAFEPLPTTNRDFGLPHEVAVGIQPYSVSAAPPACTVANAPNIAVANYASDSISYLTNNGFGQFTVRTLPTIFAPTKVIFADLDGSPAGTCDLVVMHTLNFNGTGYAISVLLTADNVTWSTVVYGLPGLPEQIAVADMNADGLPDIVVSVPQVGAILVFLNTGLGAFGAPIYTVLPVPPTRFIATYLQGTGVPAPLDFDGDGCADLAVLTPGANQVQVLTSKNPTACAATALGSGYAVASYLVDINPFGVAAADLTGDGQPELMVTSLNDSVLNVLLNSGTVPVSNATFTTFPGTPLLDQPGGQRILVGLFAGGTVPTIAVVHPAGGGVTNFKYSGGAFSTASYALNSVPFDLASGFFDLGTNLDLAVPEQKLRALYIGHGDGGGFFAFDQIGFLSTPSTPVVRRLRPGSGTAGQDIVVPMPLGNSVMILLNVNN